MQVIESFQGPLKTDTSNVTDIIIFKSSEINAMNVKTALYECKSIKCNIKFPNYI